MDIPRQKDFLSSQERACRRGGSRFMNLEELMRQDNEDSMIARAVVTELSGAGKKSEEIERILELEKNTVSRYLKLKALQDKHLADLIKSDGTEENMLKVVE